MLLIERANRTLAVAPKSQMDLLLHKLTQCLAPYEVSNATPHNIIKKQLLTEIEAYMSRLDPFTPFQEALYAKMIQFVSLIIFLSYLQMEVNAFRALPARHMPEGVIYHPDDDEQMDVSK